MPSFLNSRIPRVAATIRPGEIHLWIARTDLSDPVVDVLREMLDDEERRKAARFHQEADRRRSIIARAALRALLAGVLGRNARDLRFVHGPQGKPAVACGEVEFSVSHSDDCVAIALAASSPVGIDVECERPMGDLLDLAERFFAEPEALAVRSAAPHDAAALFYAIWTAKESVVKAAGGGLSIELGSFVVQPSPDRFTPVQNLGGDPALDGWSVLALPRVHPGCSGAVAARGNEWKTVLRRFPAAGLEGTGP